MFVAPYQVVLLVIAILGLAWGIIAFMLNKIDGVKEGVYKYLNNHLGTFGEQLTKIEKFCSKIDERTEDHDRRISRIEDRINRKNG